MGTLPADVDVDGALDLIAHVGLWEFTWSRGDGQGAFLAPRRYGAAGAILGVGDMNADGLPDVLSTGYDNPDGTLPYRATLQR